MEDIPSVLACDVGNSAIKFAHVHEDTVETPQQMRLVELVELGDRLASVWNEIPEPKYLAAASVNEPGLEALEAAVTEAIGAEVLVVGRELPLPIQTRLANPQTIGADRLCCAAGAFDRLGEACIVADFGTAITIDCVSDEGLFLGGAILPGLEMGADALAGGTSLLPHVELASPKWVFGADTKEAIIGGLVLGARGALRTIVEAYAVELGRWPVVILTGGDAALINEDPNVASIVQAVVSDLSLRGVAMAYYKSLLK